MGSHDSPRGQVEGPTDVAEVGEKHLKLHNMGQTEQLKARTICWDESVKPPRPRSESEMARSESRKQRAQRLKYLIGEKVANSPYSHQERIVLAPDIREIHPIGRHACKQHAQTVYSKATPGWNTKGDKCPSLNGSFSGRAVGAKRTREKKESCLFCRMESPSGIQHNSWCRKFFSLTEIYSHYNGTNSSKAKHRKNQNGHPSPEMIMPPIRSPVEQFYREMRFLPRRAGPSPTTPPPPPTPSDQTHYKQALGRPRVCQPTEITRTNQVTEYRFTDHPKGTELPDFLPCVEKFAAEGSMLKPHLAVKHKGIITVSPAIGPGDDRRSCTGGLRRVNVNVATGDEFEPAIHRRWVPGKLTLVQLSRSPPVLPSGKFLMRTSIAGHRQTTKQQEMVVEKLGLKHRMPHVNENWSGTERKKGWKDKPFLSQQGCTLPPMVFKGPSNTYLQSHQFVEEYAINKRLTLSAKKRLYEISKFSAERAKLSQNATPKPHITESERMLELFDSGGYFADTSDLNDSETVSPVARSDFEETGKHAEKEECAEGGPENRSTGPESGHTKLKPDSARFESARVTTESE